MLPPGSRPWVFKVTELVLLGIAVWLTDAAVKANRVDETEVAALRRAVVASGATFAKRDLWQSGFAGSNSFGLLVYDATGEIEKPPEDRDPDWTRTAGARDRLLVSPNCRWSAEKVADRIYLVMIAC